MSKKRAHGCADFPQEYNISEMGPLFPIKENGINKIKWHVDEKKLSRYLSKGEILFGIHEGFRPWQNLMHPILFEPTNRIEEAQIIIGFYENGQADLPDPPFSPDTIARAYFPDGHSFGIYSDVHFQDHERLTSKELYDSTTIHEFGHALGIMHSPDPASTMYWQYLPDVETTLTEDDIAAIRSDELYGPWIKLKEAQDEIREYVQDWFPTRRRLKNGANKATLIKIANALRLDESGTVAELIDRISQAIH